jgi:hypothetical protein
MIIHCKYDIVFVQFLLCFLYVFFNNKACNWSIEFLQIVNISKLYHILGSNHSTFYVWSFQVLFPYKFLVLKMQTLLFMKYIWKMITFHCLPSSRCSPLGVNEYQSKVGTSSCLRGSARINSLPSEYELNKCTPNTIAIRDTWGPSLTSASSRYYDHSGILETGWVPTAIRPPCTHASSIWKLVYQPLV